MKDKIMCYAAKGAEQITRRSLNIACTWFFYQPKLSKKSADKLRSK